MVPGTWQHSVLLINIITTITIYLLNPLDYKLPESKDHVALDSVAPGPTIVPDTQLLNKFLFKKMNDE